LNTFSIKDKLILTLLISSLITPIGLLSYIVLAGHHAQEEKELRAIKESQEESVLFFEHTLHQAYLDILFVSQMVQRTLANPINNNPHALKHKVHSDIDFIFKQFLEIHPLYHQIRLIDDTGQERIRFDRGPGEVVRVTEQDLQDKPASSYLQEILKLQVGDSYISDLDLNRELGLIELPHNPTLRIAIKLNAAQSGFNGIIIINISAQAMLDKIKQQSGNNIYLLDEQGYYIIHPHVDKQWSAALGTQYSVMKDFPELESWQALRRKSQSQESTVKTSTETLQFSLINSGSRFNRQWILMTPLPNLGVWDIIREEAILIKISAIAILISILLGVLFAVHWILKPIQYMEQISQQLLAGLPVDLNNPFKQKDEMSLLCQKLTQMAQIISTAREDKEQYIVSLTSEIGHRKKTEQDLSVYKFLFDCSSEAMVITDTQEEVTHVNAAFIRITGYSESEVIGKTPRLISSGKQSVDFYQQIWQQINTKGYWSGENLNKRKNGEVFPVQQSINAVSINKKTAFYVSVFSDISKSKEYEKTLRQQAYYDPLTGLANRKLLQDRLAQTIARIHRHKQHGALLFMDLDNFKHINDSLGHDFGDDLLNSVAMRLHEGFREGDTISRFGGDEFAVLIPDLNENRALACQQIENIAEKLLIILARPFMLKEHELHVSSSIGISLFPGDDIQSADEIIKMADIAMYSSKKAGKNTYRFFHADMQEKAHQRLRIEKGLRIAIKEGHFVLFYQCQYTAEKVLLGMEALIRWQHPEQGLISPDDFVPIADESGLIVAIGEIIIRQACEQIKQWESAGHTVPHISINVSPKQFAQTDFVETVSSICKEAEVSAEQLVLEITEATIIHDIDDTIDKMNQLQKLGYRISIDDFGTGYSSLSYLKRLPINQLKIDKAFVDDITTDIDNAVIVDTIIAMAQHLKLDLIAEGVENKTQLDYLKQRNCSGYQGYYFCKPVPAEKMFVNNNRVCC